MYDDRSTRPEHSASPPSASLQEIWGEDVIAAKPGRGFVAIPCVLLGHLRLLDLDMTDLTILTAIWRWRWGGGEIPYPSKPRIAEDAGIRSERTVTNHIKRMEAMGYLTVHPYASPDSRTHGYTTEGLEGLLQIIATHLNDKGKLTPEGRREVDLERLTITRAPFEPRQPVTDRGL